MLRWLHRFWFHVQGSLGRRRAGEEFDAEIETHLSLLTRENIRRGMPAPEARRAALIRFGGVTQLREDHREHSAIPHLDAFLQDLRYAFRLLRKAPGFSAIAVLTLALGIGLSTTVFTVYDSVAVRLLPVKDPGTVVRLLRWYQDGFRSDQFTAREFEYVRDQAKSFSGVVAVTSPTKVPAQDHAGADAEIVQAQLVSDNYFSMLGVTAKPGRTLLEQEGRTQPVAVLSHRFWARRFLSDPLIAGKTFLISGTAFTFVGVASESFAGTGAPPMTPDVWIPLGLAENIMPKQDLRVQVLGRRKPGVDSKQVASEMAVLGPALESIEPGKRKFLRLSANSATFFDTTGGGGFEVFLWVVRILMVAVIAVLLVGCVNLINLLLARAVTRHREIAVRCALGAGQGRIVRQLCTESLLIGMLGGIAGLVFSNALCRFLTAAIETRLAQFGIGAEYLFVDLSPDSAVFLYVVAVSLVTGVLVGLGPARQAARVGLADVMKQESGQAVGGRSRFRSWLIAAQVALCLTLLAAAGLLGRGVQNASHADPGFETKHLFLVGFPGGYQRTAFLSDIVRRLKAQPQIQSISLAAQPPLLGHSTANFNPLGSRVTVDSPQSRSLFNLVSPAYFTTLGIPLLRGRAFTRQEVEQNSSVIVISTESAQRYWPGDDPIGKRISVLKELRVPTIAGRTFTVIGIAKSVRSTNLSKVDPAYIYFPGSYSDTGVLLVRSKASPAMVSGLIRNASAAVDPVLANQLLFLNVESGPVRLQLLMTQAPATVAAVLGGLGLLLASVGIYGVVAYMVSQRTREIGLRMALGADRRSVMALVFRQALTPLLWGIPAGLAGAAIVSVLLANLMLSTETPDLLYGVNPWNPATFVGVVLFLVVIVWAASWLPARRAVRIDPADALREQ